MNAIQERKERLGIMGESIKKVFKNGKNVDKEKFVAVSMVDLGITRRLALEYLEVLKITIEFEEANGILAMSSS